MYSKKYFILLISPTLIIFTIVLIVPIILGILLSFTNWNQSQLMFDGEWIGFKNYKIALNDSRFINSIWYTTAFSLLSLIMVNILGFAFAYILNKKIFAKNLFRGIFFVPNMIGGLVLGYLWQLIFDRAIFSIFGSSPISSIASRWQALFAMSIIFTWQMAGYVMIIYLAALQNINKSLMEVAKIEGCKPVRRFFMVILPVILPAITIALFLVLNRSFKTFNINFALLGGREGTSLVSYDIYASAFVPSYNQTSAVAQAKSFIFLILVAFISVFQVYISKKFEVQN
ncbi:carbohydrate ABC transporter permease [Mesomycoplasma neurolyticum]|uniref:sn-glycerol-3-phosphate transport system permease protein ugpA n=1 Tax=Mesomycoplasma neurolyticum TaxID=2120 RepID=A0A449A5S6_9BACT|nr:sugar ABC transporter permease [Mesomycoplasma neurolyticum]VEU59579.1 sn-glycerol-3-phosphate transport system permease protein ugpA [Mesomycoplasma neurolyticum]